MLRPSSLSQDAGIQYWAENNPVNNFEGEQVSEDSFVEVTYALTVAAVARRLGVAPATLRTWDRRYGITPSDRTTGGHRRYTPTDVALLDRMRRLVILGLPPAEAARCAHTGTDPLGMQPMSVGPAGGGNVVALPGSTPSARGLARAATSLDSESMIQIVSDAIVERGTIWTWEQVVAPVLISLGKRWESTGDGIEIEHLLTDSLITSFKDVVTKLRQPINPRAVLLACAPDELHSLPTFVLAAALAERRISAKTLGPRVPVTALVSAVRKTGPAAVLVWSQLSSTGNPQLLSELPTLRPSPLVLAAGPGWHNELPPEVVRTRNMSDALNRISTAAGL
jgi:MerR family transcriptional regulator, light-induced transcriptional regulator